MRLGEKQVLTVVKKVDFGVYLGSDEERVLLPKKQVPEEIEIGDPIEVFLYKDSSDRMIATTREPKITIGRLAVLEVVDVGRLGAGERSAPSVQGANNKSGERRQMPCEPVHRQERTALCYDESLSAAADGFPL